MQRKEEMARILHRLSEFLAIWSWVLFTTQYQRLDPAICQSMESGKGREKLKQSLYFAKVREVQIIGGEFKQFGLVCLLCRPHIKEWRPSTALEGQMKVKHCRLSPNPKLSMTHLLTDPLTGVGARRCYCMNKRSSLVNFSNNRYSWSHGRAIHTSQ